MPAAASRSTSPKPATAPSIAVEDDGDGVAPELREKIFERFVTTTGGTGLGLPICRWIARAHGGDIHITAGSRFIVDLPLLPTD